MRAPTVRFYFAKEGWRNRIASHAALVALGQAVDEARTGDIVLF